jgi:hypothetical protein
MLRRARREQLQGRGRAVTLSGSWRVKLDARGVARMVRA